MLQTLKTKHEENDGVLKRLSFAFLIAVIFAGNAAFILGLVAKLNWEECLGVAVVAAALAGGGIVTVLEMKRLGKANA